MEAFFYTGLSSYTTFVAIFEYLNSGDNCENIRLRGSVTDVPEDFYSSDSDDEENVQAVKKGRRRKLKPPDNFLLYFVVWEEGSQKNIKLIFMVWLNLLWADKE